METIFKTWKKATYIEGKLKLRPEDKNWAHPIEFPSVFIAYGAAIKSGNWNSCTAINTPDYVIDNYFNKIGHKDYEPMYKLWFYCRELSLTEWRDVNKDKERIVSLIYLANTELSKLDVL